MADPADTKAAWKRRALRAEAQLEHLRRIRQFESESARRFAYQSAMRVVAIQEIEEALQAMKEAING